jgi:hypothetical protein
VLRDDEAFRRSLPFDIKNTLTIPVPRDWMGAVSGPTIEVVPLVKDPKGNYASGWCTYTYEHEGAPELEVFCGGVNSKTPKAGAVWRQGNLMHFGFDLAPAQMNDAGKALLVDVIAYISRFTEDRPIVHTPCVFVQGTRVFDRGLVGRLLAHPDLGDLQHYLAKAEWEGLKGKERAEVASWFREAGDYLHADAAGKLSVDTEARTFGVGPARPEFIEKAIAALDAADRAPAARSLLARYVPDGPGASGNSATWRAWWEGNRPYLFFTDTGGYRWLIDPLAKKRGIPTEKLRGRARASLPLPKSN